MKESDFNWLKNYMSDWSDELKASGYTTVTIQLPDGSRVTWNRPEDVGLLPPEHSKPVFRN